MHLAKKPDCQWQQTEAIDLLGIQSRYLEELSAPLRPHQQAVLDQCAELGRIQRNAFPHVPLA